MKCFRTDSLVPERSGHPIANFDLVVGNGNVAVGGRMVAHTTDDLLLCPVDDGPRTVCKSSTLPEHLQMAFRFVSPFSDCLPVCLEERCFSGIFVIPCLCPYYHDEPKESEVPYFLAQELIPGYLEGMEGTYCPPKGYFVADERPEAFAAFESTFPLKEKHLSAGQLPQFCQSCGMPLTQDADCGCEADGRPNFDYCRYCYKEGAFTGDYTMEGMAECCSQFVDHYNKESGQRLTREAYKEMLLGFYPRLKRWR